MTQYSKSTTTTDRPVEQPAGKTGQDKPTLLLVDDEPKNLRLLEALLVPLDYELLTAESGEESLKVIAENKVDLILLDVMMPGMDGYEVTKKLRAAPDTRLLPIIIISALRETGYRVDGIQAGCDDFICKPFDKSEVLAKIQTTLKLSYYRRQLDEKEQFEAVISRISEGIIVCEPDWTVRIINAQGKRYLSHTQPGSNLLDSLFDAYTVSVSRSHLAACLTESNERFRIARSEADAGPSYVDVSMDVLKDPDGNVVSLVLALRDMTDERRKEKLKEDFLNVVSQKLRGPLAAVSRGLSRFREGALGALSEDQTLSVDAMATESRILAGLVEKLVRFSIVNSGSIISNPDSSLPREEIALKTYLPRLLESTMGSEDKTVDLDFDIKDSTARVKISSVYFNAIISNLVENAIKFCDKDVVMLGVVVDKTDKTVAISIRDNGPGIHSDEKDRVFEPFYQIGRDSAESAEGAGLGLPLVKRLVAAYGGDVRLDSDPGRGTTFTVTLPAA